MPDSPLIRDMLDLTDTEIDRWLSSVPCARYEPADMQRMAREIRRRRESDATRIHALETKMRAAGEALQNFVGEDKQEGQELAAMAADLIAMADKGTEP